MPYVIELGTEANVRLSSNYSLMILCPAAPAFHKTANPRVKNVKAAADPSRREASEIAWKIVFSHVTQRNEEIVHSISRIYLRRVIIDTLYAR